ncbi:TIGR04211 family SH3 domain-containing protein [Allohahella marinimesophila]|uniref:TIGR04211 family SH3 domain-containing protein n=1 Tax=Allohahella marinimesophila TaxID=1054972 RepID=A0ABP7NQL3_9GAMM
MKRVSETSGPVVRTDITRPLINFICALGLILSFPALAERKYIDDTLFAPLNSGEGLNYRIVHRGLKSGTPVEVISTNKDTGYSKVREPGGVEGYLPTRFLSDQPIARDRLEKLTKETNQMRSDFEKIRSENLTLRERAEAMDGERAKLSKENAALERELSELKRISEGAIALDATNREFRETNERLKNEVDLLTAENDRLKEEKNSNAMLHGGGLVALGILIAVILPMFRQQKRSSW